MHDFTDFVANQHVTLYDLNIQPTSLLQPIMGTK